MKHIKRIFESDEENILEIVEDYLLELTDLGWKIREIKETHISDNWRPYTDLPLNGFWIILNPPFGINLNNDNESQALSNLTNHFNKWSEWLSVIPSVLKKLELHIGEINVSSHFGEHVQWGGTRWMCIMVKRKKI